MTDTREWEVRFVCFGNDEHPSSEHIERHVTHEDAEARALDLLAEKETDDVFVTHKPDAKPLAVERAATSGNTNGGLKLNRLRLYRAQWEVRFYEHLTTGGRKFDDFGVECAKAMAALAREIEACERMGGWQ